MPGRTGRCIPTRRGGATCWPSSAPHCHADVTGVAQVAVQAYDRIEIPEITPDVTRVTLHGGVCPCCAKRFKAPPPAGLEPGSPFGPNLRAFVLYLRFGQAIPFERLARLMSDLFGLEISEGALANLLDDSAPAFAAQTSRIKQRLLSGTAPAIRRDQRARRQDDLLDLGLPSRRQRLLRHPALARQGGGGEFLGDFRPEIWVSDRLGAQMGWATTEHQVCLAHLLRDIQYAIDAGDAAFAPGLKNLLKRAGAHRPPPPGPGRRHPGRLPLPAPGHARRTAQDRARHPSRARNFSA